MFFEKIDELENEISNGTRFESLQKKYNLKLNVEENFKINGKKDTKEFYKKIYENAEIKKLELLDENDFYILYEINRRPKKYCQILKMKNLLQYKRMLFNKSPKGFFNKKIAGYRK